MTAPQTVGTPAAAPAAPPPTAAEPISAGSHGLDAILGDLSDLPAEATETEEPADPLAQEADTAEAAETEPTDKAQKLDDEVIFSDEALNTKEGVLKAKARIRDLRKLTHQKYVELKAFEGKVRSRHEKLKSKVDRFVSEKRNHDLLLGNVRSNLQGLHSGDPDAILTALGNLTGTDGLKAYELLTSRIINRGKPALDPQVQALIDQQQQQIEELKQGFAAKATEERVQQLTSRVEQRKQQIGQQITASAQQVPHLARLYADNPEGVIEHVTTELVELHKSGQRVDIGTYFANVERELARHFGASPAQAPQGDGGGPASKQPSQAQRSPGQSVGPRTAAVSNSRVPTEEESLRALANDTAFLSQFGI